MDKKLNNIIKRYREHLEKAGIRVKKIILYGSYASGKPKEWSDIDLIVISNDFKKMDLWERLVLLGRTAAKTMEPLEVLGYTEKEFASHGKGTFVGDEVKPKGIEVI